MISPREMVPLLVEASPAFDATWRQFQVEWAKDPPPPYYLVLSDFVRHMSHLMAEGDEATLRRIFAVIERFHLEGDHYVQEAATIGLLEDLQNTNLHSGTTPEQFRPLLLPESARWWKKVEDFWQSGKLITND